MTTPHEQAAVIGGAVDRSMTAMIRALREAGAAARVAVFRAAHPAAGIRPAVVIWADRPVFSAKRYPSRRAYCLAEGDPADLDVLDRIGRYARDRLAEGGVLWRT